jgi:kumamolisin
MNEAFQSAAALGISVFVAAGDSGAGDDMNDGECHVDFPASSPCVTACGGTKLVMDKNIRQEVVWNESENGEGATGGGISDVFPRPSYQQNVGSIPPNLSGGMSGRALPDVAAVADPETGYAVFVNGGWNIIGGTSAVAPLFAGLLARINQQLGRNAGLINPTLYAAGVSCGFNDIQTGDNSYNGVRGYVATAGWDPVTGWGSPGGNALLKLLSASAGPSWAGQ